MHWGKPPVRVSMEAIDWQATLFLRQWFLRTLHTRTARNIGFQYQKRNMLWNIRRSKIQKKSIDEEILINHNWDILRRIMWNYVGIVRKKKRLEKAEQQIADLRSEINEILKSNKLSPNMLELRNIMLVASLIVGAAIKRKHSAGLHYILDTEKMK